MAFACLFAPDFPAQAVIRPEPELRGKAVVILEGPPPLTKVVSSNETARSLGVTPGMTRVQAESCGEIACRWRSAAREKTAHAALLDCAWAISPRVEAPSGEGEEPRLDTVVLDLRGCKKLFGSTEKIAGDLRRIALGAGLAANVGAAANPQAAICAARGFPGITVIPEGEEGKFLGALPLSSLHFPAEFAGTLGIWGISTCGQLAALPELAIVERFGQEGRRFQLLAQGADARPLLPREIPRQFEECLELDFAVDLLEPLLFVLNRLLEQLCTRLRMHVLAANELQVTLALQPDDSRDQKNLPHVRTIRLPAPVKESKFLLKLLQLDLQKHPPPLPVIAVHLSAIPARARSRQPGLFLPLSPEPERLEATLARIEDTVGEGRAGAPALLDTHRPRAFEQKHFVLHDTTGGFFDGGQETRAALRVYRPPLFAKVEWQGEKPGYVICGGRRRRILAFAGPWRSKGDWWSETAWARDEWDVLLHSLRPPYRESLARSANEESSLYRIYRDLHSKQWFVEGIYD